MRAGVQTVLRIGVCTGCPISDFAILILSVLLTEKCFGSTRTKRVYCILLSNLFDPNKYINGYLNGICSPKYVFHDIRISSKLIISTNRTTFYTIKKTKVTRSRNNSTFIQNIFFALYCAQDISSLIFLTCFLS